MAILQAKQAPLINVSAAPLIQARDVTVVYNGETALDRLTFTVQPGDQVAIIGPNGAGKSTLIKTLLGFIRPSSGAVNIAIPRERIGYVAQNEAVDWNYPVTVQDVVMMGCARRIGWFRPPRREHWDLVHAALERVGMADLRQRQIGELSGGQRRRAFIARALAQEAELLILDEPFSGVDASAQASLMDVLDQLNAGGLTILLSTHDLDLAFARFSKVMALRRHLIAFGDPRAVLTADTLAHIYGHRVMTWQDGQEVAVFVDEHHCENCPD
ncbi:MAG: metal ABC transporter ATP-binding protein [Anaerolinea sp.]|nr:metal ABC transporter ATP-binding protein [Anaerolinea sp.]